MRKPSQVPCHCEQKRPSYQQQLPHSYLLRVLLRLRSWDTAAASWQFPCTRLLALSTATLLVGAAVGFLLITCNHVAGQGFHCFSVGTLAR